jgi:hypothetical protein
MLNVRLRQSLAVKTFSAYEEDLGYIWLEQGSRDVQG